MKLVGVVTALWLVLVPAFAQENQQQEKLAEVKLTLFVLLGERIPIDPEAAIIDALAYIVLYQEKCGKLPKNAELRLDEVYSVLSDAEKTQIQKMHDGMAVFPQNAPCVWKDTIEKLDFMGPPKN